MGRWPLKMTRSKQESTATIKLVNLATKRDSVFMASSSGLGPQQTPFCREDAVFAHPFWLRLCRVRGPCIWTDGCGCCRAAGPRRHGPHPRRDHGHRPNRDGAPTRSTGSPRSTWRRRRRGERPTPSEYAARHPELAARILELFPALELIERLKPDAGGRCWPARRGRRRRGPAVAAGDRLRRLGDYAISASWAAAAWASSTRPSTSRSRVAWR